MISPSLLRQSKNLIISGLIIGRLSTAGYMALLSISGLIPVKSRLIPASFPVPDDGAIRQLRAYERSSCSTVFHGIRTDGNRSSCRKCGR
jgi:hypothetical protein